MDTDQLNQLVSLIEHTARPIRIVLFGSHARGDATTESDIDLLVILPDHADRWSVSAEVRRRIAEQRITLPIELLFQRSEDYERRRQVKGHLFEVVEQEGQILHAA